MNQLITMQRERKIDDFLMDRLPMEIITDILSRLPIRYVFRCKLVCKTWRSLINDNPRFPIMHFNNSACRNDNNSACRNDNPTSLVLQAFADSIRIVELDHNAGVSYKPSKEICPNLFESYPLGSVDSATDDSPRNSRRYPLGFVGSCNGLVCFEHCVSFIHICNPTTGEYATLPPHVRLTMHYKHITYTSLGFGFDPSAKVFKVIQIFQSRWKDTESEAQVYTVGSRSWRKVSKGNAVRDFCFRRRGCFVNGSIHWLGSFPNLTFHIASFHLGSERFGVIPSPRFTFPSRFGVEIGVLGDSLCISNYSSFSDNVEMWVMKNHNMGDSWTKQFVLRLDSMKKQVPWISKLRVVCVAENGELVLQCKCDGEGSSFCYNLESGNARKIEDEEIPKRCYNLCSEVFPYVRTLISPKLNGEQLW